LKKAFKVGDTVIVKSQGWDKPEIVGKKAKVLKVARILNRETSFKYHLEFFENVNGHTCGGSVEMGHGYYIGDREMDDLELVSKQLEFPF